MAATTSVAQAADSAVPTAAGAEAGGDLLGSVDAIEAIPAAAGSATSIQIAPLTGWPSAETTR